MHYIIDGYNLLFRFYKEKSNLETKRRELIGKLDEIATILHLDITLIFDGHYSEEDYVRTHTRSLEIIYTELGESADETILNELDLHPNPNRVTVITSDRDLSYKAKRRRANVETSKEFFKMITKRAQKKKREKPPSSTQEKTFLTQYDHYLLKTFEEKIKEMDLDES